MTETDIIGHLIQIESEAANMLLDAQTEVDRRITEAKQKADNLYKEKYENLIKELDTQFEAKKNQVLKDCNIIIDDYKEKVLSSNQDKRAFNLYLDSIIFGSNNG